MKIAVSSTGERLNSKVSEEFGRCPYFINTEIEHQKIKKAKKGQAIGLGIKEKVREGYKVYKI